MYLIWFRIQKYLGGLYFYFLSFFRNKFFFTRLNEIYRKFFWLCLFVDTIEFFKQ